jgi:trigger factor
MTHGDHDHELSEHTHAPFSAEVEKISPVKRKLKVTVPAEAVAEEYAATLEAVRKVAQIKGFRPGKMPREMVEQHYRAEVEKETIEQLIRHSFGHAMEDHQLDPLNQPEVTDLHFKRGEEFRYAASFEVRPEIVLAPYKGLKLKREAHPAGDAEVEAQLERLRDMQSVLKPRLAGAEIAKGDFAVLDLAGRVDGQLHPKLKADNHTLQAGAGMIYPEVDEALIGKKEGDSFSATVTLSPELEEKELAGKSAELLVTVRAIKQKVLPELDDAFAAQLGGESKTLLELRQRIRQDLEAHAAQATEEKLRDEALRLLIDANRFEVPESLLFEEVKHLMARTAQRMQLRGIKVEAEKFGQKETVEHFKKMAEENLRRDFILQKIAAAEKIEVGDPEIEQQLDKMAAESGVKREELAKVYAKEEQRDELRFRLRSQKSLDFVVGQAKIS